MKNTYSKKVKFIACFTAANMLWQIIFPTAAMALTSGPNQPELTSFEPVGTNQMVDLFSGDFTYNLPLLTVPGPNGGYPINLAYHAGVGMEEEASWVGLGWNINPGVINKQMRGIPDEFDGTDQIIKQTHFKPSLSYGFEMTPIEKELAGISMNGISWQAHWNNHKGIGMGIGLTAPFKDVSKSGFSSTLRLNYSSNGGGLDVDPSISYASQNKDKNTKHEFGVGFSMNSISGTKAVNYSIDKQKEKSSGNRNYSLAGSTFVSSSFIPYSENKTFGTEERLGISFGSSASVVSYLKNKNIKGYSAENILISNVESINAYGYNNFHKATGDVNALTDHNRERDVPVVKTSPHLPIPQQTYDIYSVNGQGIGHTFRPYRSEIGYLTDKETKNKSIGTNFRAEFGFGTATNIGADLGFNHTNSYVGMWKDANSYAPVKNLIYRSQGNQTNEVESPFYEPFYFKSMGSTAVNNNNKNTIGGDRAVKFNLKLKYETGPANFAFNPILSGNNVTDNSGNNYLIPNNYDNFRTERDARVEHIQYRTNSEIISTEHYRYNMSNGFSNYAKHLNYINTFNGWGSNSQGWNYAHHNNKPHHIGEIVSVNPDGNKYVYGIPVYNKVHKEVSFSVDGPSSVNQSSIQNKTVQYFSTGNNPDNSIKNNKGEDNLFVSNSMPEYVTAYLLTCIYSRLLCKVQLYQRRFV
jgi:hypothetical protein